MAKYQFGEKIGCGGFGEVFAGFRSDDGWLCAIKRLQQSADAQARQRFHREVRMQAQLRHDNIVPVVGYNLEDELPWFVMPRAFCNLRDHLKVKKGIDQIWVVMEVAAGLEHAHSNGVIHRDLKPENVLLFESKEELYVAIGDFGLGRFSTRDSPSLTSTDIRMGTIEYMAPEQYTDAKHVDKRADIYSLGKITYELLTGEIPYPELEYSKLPTKFVYIVKKACETDREKRYQSVGEMVNDLNIVTQKENLLTKPSEMIRDEVKAILEEQNFQASRVERLGRILMENTDDNEVLTGVLPRLPDPILERLVKDYISLLSTVLKVYDKAVSEALPFDYCDTVALFYEKVFNWTDSVEIKVMILERLPEIGFSHNRWYVGEVFARIVAGLKDPSLVLAVKNVLQRNQAVGGWCQHYLQKHSLPHEIRSVLKGIPSS